MADITQVFSNKTEFAIKSDVERYTWAVFHMFIFLSSLVGDSLILIAAIKYRAFKINRLILVTIKHIAVSDLCVALFTILPRTVSLIVDEQLFGTVMCKIKFCFSYFFGTVGVFLMCGMTTCKVATLQYPLRTNALSSKNAHKACIAIWFSILSLPALLAAENDAVLDYRMNTCDMNFKTAIWRWLRPLLTIVFSVIPNVLVTASTIRLLFMAKQAAARRNKNVNMQGVVTIILVAVVYHASLLPYAVYNIAESRIADKRSFFHKEYYRISVSFLSFNIISNFFIYNFTIESFRQFLYGLARRSPRIFPTE